MRDEWQARSIKSQIVYRTAGYNWKVAHHMCSALLILTLFQVFMGYGGIHLVSSVKSTQLKCSAYLYYLTNTLLTKICSVASSSFHSAPYINYTI